MQSDDLFATDDASLRPLADRMRPSTLDGYIGQEHLLGEGKPLRRAIESGRLHSMIFWGPPGTGKTTLARLLAGSSGYAFHTLSAVLAGVKDIRAAVEQARQTRAQTGHGTVLFIDEVHRFNKSQQDAFLPHVEDGTLLFVGATTENPSFELNNALLSRARVYVLKSLAADALNGPAAACPGRCGHRVWATCSCRSNDDALGLLAEAADGDARRALNLLEIAADLAEDGVITDQVITEVAAGQVRRFDKGGEAFYDQISALHKSVRGSSPDGALYWLCRMLDGGCDPCTWRVGWCAWPRRTSATPTRAVWRSRSMPGRCRNASAVPRVSWRSPRRSSIWPVPPRAMRSTEAYNQAMAAAKDSGSLEVPIHLRNAPTRLMKELGYGKAYRYAHDEPGAYAAGETYLPEELQGQRFYQPVDRGLEIRIGEKLAQLRALDKQADGSNES